MSKKSVAVQIAGHEYKIRTDSDGESLRKIALYVDRAMQRVREGTGTVDSLDVAVLTCLNLAREILALKEQGSGRVNESSLRMLIERVEAAIPGMGGDRTSGDLSEEGADAAKSSGSGEAAPAVSAESTATDDSSGPSVKTLDLPSVETLRERGESSSAQPAEATSEDALPEARMAAGGRDRAS